MTTMNRRSFLRGAAAAAGVLPTALRAAAPAAPVSFFLVGDTHYHADEMNPGVLDPRSREVTRRLIDQLNRLPGMPIPETAGGGTVPEPAGVIHAGDIIDSGDKNGAKFETMQRTELQAFEEDWGLEGGDGRLRWPVREVHGNHDGPQGRGACIDRLIERNRRRRGLTGVSSNGLHCSWDWGGVHFVNLGIVVGQDPAVTRRRRYAPMDSLAFLHEDLARTGRDASQPLVITHHVDMMRYAAVVEDAKVQHHEWDYADVKAYWESIRSQRVAAVLYGHTHARNLYRWNGQMKPAPAGEAAVPVCNTDNASHFKDRKQALMMVTVDAAGTTFREYATTDAWETGVWTPQVWRFPLAGA